MNLRSQRRQGFGLGPGTVPDMGLQPGFAQAFCHRQAHEADSDKSNAHHGLQLHQQMFAGVVAAQHHVIHPPHVE